MMQNPTFCVDDSLSVVPAPPLPGLPTHPWLYPFKNCPGRAESLELVLGHHSIFSPDCWLLWIMHFSFLLTLSSWLLAFESQAAEHKFGNTLMFIWLYSLSHSLLMYLSVFFPNHFFHFFSLFQFGELLLQHHPFHCLYLVTLSVQFSHSYPTLCDPMDGSMPGFPVHHQLPEFTQTRINWVSDAIQPSHPLSSPSPDTFNLSQHQGLFQ